MGHMLNYGLTTSAKGASWEQVRLKYVASSTNNFTLDEDCGAGLFSTTITKNGTGNYTLQMNKPYPAALVIVSPEMTCSSNTTAAVVARMQAQSYSATNGTIVLFTSNSAGTGATDPNDQDECHIMFVFRRYTAKP